MATSDVPFDGTTFHFGFVGHGETTRPSGASLFKSVRENEVFLQVLAAELRL